MIGSNAANLGVFKFDAHAEINSYPETDLIGPGGLTIECDDGLITASLVIGISTMDDENLFRLDALIGQMFRRVKPGSIIPLVDAETGQKYGNLQVMGQLSVLPVELTKIRAFRGIAIHLGSDQTLFS